MKKYLIYICIFILLANFLLLFGYAIYRMIKGEFSIACAYSFASSLYLFGSLLLISFCYENKE